MKRRLTELLLLGLLAIALIACGSTAPTTTAKPDSTAAAAEKPQTDSGEKALDHTTIRIYLAGPGYSAMERVWENVSAVCGDRLNADFDITFFPWGDEYPQKLQLAISSGESFDLCFDADWWSYNTLVNQGAYLDLAKLAPEYMPAYYERLEETGNLSACFVGEGMYCIPWEAPYNARPHFVWKDYVVENPVTDSFQDGEITTMEQIDEFLGLVKAANPDFNHLFECYGDYDIVTFLQPKYNYAKWDFHYLTFKLNEDKIVIEAEEQTEMFEEVGRWAKKWVEDGFYPRDIATNNAAHASLGDDHHFSGFGMFEYIAYKDNLTKEGYHYSLMYPDGYFVNKSPTNNLLAMNKNAANPERALMFLDLLYVDDAVFDAVMYGIKDDTYTIDDEGNYVWAEEGMDNTNTSWMEWNSQWAFWRVDKLKPTPARNKECWDLNNEFMKRDTNIPNPLAGFVPDPTNIKNELATRDSLYSELGFMIEYGLVDDLDAAIAEYRTKQEEAGLEKILTEIQSQVDNYMAGLKSD